jgi:hypothetical protein
MRYTAWVFLLWLLGVSPAWAQIGPPAPRAGQHGFSLGVGVHNAASRWMPYDYDVDRNRIYFEGSYGFTDNVELFGRVGLSDWVVNDIESYEPGMVRDVSSDGYPAFLSIGLRGRAWQCGRLSLGASLEAAWYAGLERDIRWNYDAYQELYFDPTTEINAAASLGWDLGRGVLYAGPLVHFAHTRVDVRTHEFGPEWDIEERVDGLVIGDKNGVGGFFGWRVPLGNRGWQLQLEGAGLRGGLAGALGFFRSW